MNTGKVLKLIIYILPIVSLFFPDFFSVGKSSRICELNLFGGRSISNRKFWNSLFKLHFVEGRVVNMKRGYSFFIKFKTLIFSCSYNIITFWFLPFRGVKDEQIAPENRLWGSRAAERPLTFRLCFSNGDGLANAALREVPMPYAFVK